jgi:hypothetical protein
VSSRGPSVSAPWSQNATRYSHPNSKIARIIGQGATINLDDKCVGIIPTQIAQLPGGRDVSIRVKDDLPGLGYDVSAIHIKLAPPGSLACK